MLNNRNILCISGTEWNGNYIKAVVELMKVLADTNNVLFVENAYTYKDALKGVSDKDAIDFKKVFGLKSRIRTLQTDGGGTVHILFPPLVFPVNFLPAGGLYNTLLKFNAWLLRRVVQKALKKLNMQHNLINFTSFNPAMGLMNGHAFGEKTLIYHCYDEIKGAHSWLSRHGLRLEAGVMKIADAVIVTSQGLYESKNALCKQCFIVKNAVKVDLFKKGFNRLPNPGKKVVGYIGTIDDRSDYNILQHLFTGMPDAEFVFVGRILSDKGLAILKKYPNVKIEGPKMPDQLPAYLQSFSAGIIPFVKDDLTRGIYPMKINEYLAAGLPVVSTAFGDIADFTGLIKITDDKETFLQYVRSEIAEDSAEKRRERLKTAENNTWDKRAEEISNVIEQVEAGR
ncbi:glycosyltransferase [Mucilaginibacter phyllosphaerae]|uniref:Glycosyltransferase n=1 Tax=Mucilaginibacter phyllosphaerae TaxID=1812349 RepID=A0A4Y8AEL5_9SPHI|nr:glycosyltransferase [Mucilaginibacter phyllosphaerae]MBB3970253.1 glycosyltransferase involved in cell wall biosynthesis [Mucilaginibacter phyllosphaerae]TEW66632.1 glycosyltransferase [Mucilaginibacter phyllosphaerae]GGH10825.1 glycosyl transferase [Mucilaginibacter phyllosphaerae]